MIGPGLKRSYRRGRNRFRDVRAEVSDEGVHEWRKRVKDLWYHLRLVRNAKKSVLGEAADEAHELSDLLGDHHDLAVLRDDAVERRELFGDGDLESLIASISERQDELAANAISLGERFYARKPRRSSGGCARTGKAGGSDGVREGRGLNRGLGRVGEEGGNPFRM